MADLGVGGACARVVASRWVVSRYVVTGPPGLLIVAVLLVGLSASVCGGSGSGVTAEEQAAARYDAGLELQRQGKLDEAISEFDAAILIKPKFAEAHYSRGLAYEQQAKIVEALQDFAEAILIDPQHAQLYSSRVSPATSSEDYERALADYNQAVRSDPESAVAYAGRAAGRAVAYAGRAVAYAGRAVAYAGRAVAYALLNMDAEADLDVKTAVELGFDPTLLGQIIESLKR